jgi:hypothetical protein
MFFYVCMQVGDYLVFQYFGPYGVILDCVLTTLSFPVITDGKFTFFS